MIAKFVVGYCYYSVLDSLCNVLTVHSSFVIGHRVVYNSNGLLRLRVRSTSSAVISVVPLVIR